MAGSIQSLDVGIFTAVLLNLMKFDARKNMTFRLIYFELYKSNRILKLTSFCKLKEILILERYKLNREEFELKVFKNNKT